MPRGAKRSVYIPIDELRRLYVEERLPSDEIGARFGCSNVTVLVRLREAGVPIRHHNDTKRGRPARNRINLDVERVVRAYLAAENIAQAEIARAFGVSVPVINRILRENGVRVRTVSEVIQGKRDGAANPNWRADISDEERLSRRDMAKQAKWRRLVYERDGFECQKCGDDRGGNLNAHHVVNHRDEPATRWDVENGITLCADCHREFHKKFGYTGNSRMQLDGFLRGG
jgi:transcriptional regulator with XRE-family HTH domain